MLQLGLDTLKLVTRTIQYLMATFALNLMGTDFLTPRNGLRYGDEVYRRPWAPQPCRKGGERGAKYVVDAKKRRACGKQYN